MNMMKDESPFRHTLVGCEPTLASGLRLRGYYTMEALTANLSDLQMVMNIHCIYR